SSFTRPAPSPISVRTGATESFQPGNAPPTCRGCGQPLSQPGTVPAWICGACDDYARNQPQPIPGYRLLRKLGQGAMGVVYLAMSKADGQPVAVKTVTPAVAGSPPQVQRFLREAEILRQLQHAHIVGFRDVGEADGAFYFAMDHVAG